MPGEGVTVVRMACVFCEIVAGTARPSGSTRTTTTWPSWTSGSSPGDTLVIPKLHSVDLTDTPPETLAGMAAVGQRVACATWASSLAATGNNVAINDGKSAFQSVFHIHLHVVPRRDRDKVSFAKDCCCAGIPTGRAPERSCARRWRCCRERIGRPRGRVVRAGA